MNIEVSRVTHHAGGSRFSGICLPSGPPASTTPSEPQTMSGPATPHSLPGCVIR